MLLSCLRRTIYAMMGTMFIQQGSLMDNRVALPGTGITLRIPAATMALFNTGAIILLVPLYDTFFEPALKRCGVRWTLLRRIGEQRSGRPRSADG
jgi:peptide/histidine transporter 3/4